MIHTKTKTKRKTETAGKIHSFLIIRDGNLRLAEAEKSVKLRDDF